MPFIYQNDLLLEPGTNPMNNCKLVKHFEHQSFQQFLTDVCLIVEEKEALIFKELGTVVKKKSACNRVHKLTNVS